MGDYTTVSIPKELHEDVQEFIEDTNFTSVGEFTKHLLRDTVGSGALHKDLTEEEIEQVRKRLKRLGYIE